MKLKFLGTGTSFGVPVIGCSCDTCRSNDLRDKRFRSAAMIESEQTRIVIDCGPDIRMQLLRESFRKIDAVLLTHGHYDHIAGIDDLRPYCDFDDIDIYANKNTAKAVRRNFAYCFADHLYPGVPKLFLHEILGHKPLQIGDIEVAPFRVLHGKMPILGYRFGSLAYITDMKSMEESELKYLEGIDCLVVNALRWEEDHHSHMIVEEAIEFAQKVGARQTYFTHLTHNIGLHADADKRLPQGFHFAYDGLILDF